MENNLKAHWENIYLTKQPNQVSWTQAVPEISLEFIRKFNLPKESGIIDIGGGDSRLVDYLLDEGYSDISVLDISEAAIERAKKRLGERAVKVQWIVSDVLEFVPDRHYDLWHDRAVFHFQTDLNDIENYLNKLKNAVLGQAVIGTFSTDGPKKCSGLEVKQYDENGLKEIFKRFGFNAIECKRQNHISPSGAVQNFVFCSFEKTKSLD